MPSGQQQDKSFPRRGGGYVLFTGQRGAGEISFTVKMHKRNIFGGGSRIKWVLNFVDDRNYLLFEMDNKFFYPTEVVDGKKQEGARVLYSLGNADFLHINIMVTANSLLQRCNNGNNNWQTLMESQPGASTPSLNQSKTKNFTAGSFGFHLPGMTRLKFRISGSSGNTFVVRQMQRDSPPFSAK